MADAFGGYGGFAGVPHPYWLSPHPSASTPPFLPTYLVESYPMIPHGSYHQSPPSCVDNSRSPSSFYAQPGDSGSGVYFPSMKTSSPVVYCPPMESQHSPTVSSLADMLIRNSQQPFYVPIPPSGVCATTNAFDLNRPPGHYYSAYDNHESVTPAAPPVEPSVPVSSEAIFDGSQPGGRSADVVSSHLIAKSSDSLYKEKEEGSGGVSSLYQRPTTLVAESENGVSETSLKNAFDYLNCYEHRSWDDFMVSSEGSSAPTVFSVGSESCGAAKVDNGIAAQSAVNSKNSSDGSASQPSEDFQASQKTFKFQEHLDDIMNRDKKTTLLTDLSIKGSSRSNADDVSAGQSPVCDQGDLTSPASSTRVSSVVNAMHNLSEVLVYECFNSRSVLEPEQLESLDKVVDNLTKCLKKITSNNTLAGEASVPSEALHVSCPNVVDVNEAPNVDAKDFQGFNVKPLDSFGFKEWMDKDKDEMTQSIKNVLASNFPDGEENHPQTLLYKNLWLETEAALCSTTCLARYHRIQNESGNLKLQNTEISADASTLKQESFLNPQESDSIMNIVEQETAESLIKDRSSCGNTVVTMSRDAPQSSSFNSDPVDAVLSLLSRSFTGGLEQENHGNFKPGAQIPDVIQQESHASTTEEKHNDVIDRFQILKQQETNYKLKSQDCSETSMDELEENPEASEMATIGRSSHMSDVMGRFQLLKRREAEQVQKSLNSVDLDSDSDSDQSRNRTKRSDCLWSGRMMTTGGIETWANAEASAYDKGYESPTSDWEYVRKDD